MVENAETAKAGWYNDGTGRQRWWDGSQWTDSLAPVTVVQQASVPGRVPGFVLGLIAILFTTLPIVCLPLGIIGWVQSAKALKRLPSMTHGRGLAVAGLVLSIVAVSSTTLIMLLAIPGAWVHNFG